MSRLMDGTRPKTREVRMKTGKLLALMLPLVLVMVLAVACGSDEPAPAPTAAPAQPGLTAAELQAELQSAIAGIQIPEGLSEADVTNIVEGAAQPGISADDVSKIVSDQLAKQPGISAADLQKAVDDAVKAAGGMTAADLRAAIAGIQIPEGLSADDLSKIVSDQLAAQPGITAADLQKAVDAAVVLAVAAAVPADPAQGEVAQQGTLDVAFQQLLTFGTDYTVRTPAEIGFASTISSEPLLKLNRDGQVVPGLISEWSLDGTVWTFKVQKGVEFHRGWGNMTSDDVIFTFQEIGGEDSISSGADRTREYFFAEGGGMTKVDDYT
ncbi:MAG TPA: hypothetical protein EYO83_13890, partial [Gemmatimonadetes bacterium]|nr:hypothetical protein [Gemmatimonadota bacterium]